MAIRGANSDVSDETVQSPPPRWRVELFGGPAVVHDGQARITRFATTNTALLLAVLAYPPRRAHSREELASLFWPEVALQVSRTRLSNTITELQQATELPFLTDGQEVTLEDAGVECDVAEFVTAIARAASAPPDDDSTRALHLGAAVRARTGEFLPGLFHDWVIERRGHLTEQYRQVLCHLSGCKSRLGEPETAVALARQAVALDGWDERAQEALLRALAMAGRSAAAHMHTGSWRSGGGRSLARDCRGGWGMPSPPALELLRERSLIAAEESADGAMRYRMLESMREFAQLLATRGQRQEAERLHAEYFVAFAEAAEPHVSGPEQADWLTQLQAEHDNLRAALQWCLDNGDGERGLRLAAALSTFCEVRGYLVEGQTWFRRLDDIAGLKRLV